MASKPLDVPMQVFAEDGAVYLDAPGIVGAMTPDAALGTADRLITEATKAIGQQAMSEIPLRPVRTTGR